MLVQAELRKVDKEGRTATFIISDESLDRHGSILTFSGWDLKNYRKNPIVSYNHAALGFGHAMNPNPDYIIGRSEITLDKEKKQVIGKVYFEDAENNPLAEKIFKKVQAKILGTASVGFVPLEWDDENESGVRRIKKKELIEWSITDISSNPNATATKQLADLEKRCYWPEEKRETETIEDQSITELYQYKLKLEDYEA